MSWLSKFLGLDKNPKALAVLNEVGHEAASLALTVVPEADINSKLAAVVDKTVGPILDKLPIPAEDAGIAKWYLGTTLKAGIDAELSAFEPTASDQQNGQQQNGQQQIAQQNGQQQNDGSLATVAEQSSSFV